MKINSSLTLHPDSRVRGIGSYNQMLEEALSTYGKENNLEFSATDADLNLVTDFNFFQKLKINPQQKNILVLHDLIPLQYPKYFPVGWRGKWTSWQNLQLIKRFSGVITDTQFIKEQIVQKLNLPSQRVKVVSPAAKALFEAGREKIESKFSNLPKKFILYVGDVTGNKNLPNLARAVKQINYPLVLVGAAFTKEKELSHPWYSSFREFKQLTEGSKLFIFPGFVSEKELKDLYQKAGVVVLPSFAEGFGFPWLEAAWLKTPVVLGQSEVTREVAGDTAIFVDPFSPQLLGNALRSCLLKDQSELTARAAKRARSFSQAKFIVKLSEALYNILNV